MCCVMLADLYVLDCVDVQVLLAAGIVVFDDAARSVFYKNMLLPMAVGKVRQVNDHLLVKPV